ncbi:MAG: YbhN family protein [Haloarculaceae archaeon]
MGFEVDRRATIVGFLGAAVVLSAIAYVVGVHRILATLLRADPPVLLLVLVAAATWLTAWGLALRTVLRVLGANVSVPQAALVFAGSTFANNVTPFGQAGGEPVSALIISQAAESEYETGLAAIASVDALHFVPSVTLATVGLGYVAATTVLGRQLRMAAIAVGALGLAMPLAAYVGWRHRYAVEATVVRLLTPVIRLAGRVLPRRAPPDPHVIERRIESFFAAVDRVARDRRALVAVVGFSLVGWLALAGSLWLSLFSLGVVVPPPALLVVVPVASIAGFTPLPGGLGGVETVLVALLGTAAGVDPAVAVAAVFLHRGATYLLPTAVGGGVASAMGAR